VYFVQLSIYHLGFGDSILAFDSLFLVFFLSS
jgi:hypothetical protein